MWKKFLSVVLSVSMFVCPLSIFAAQTNQFEEVCNFYDYANQDLISSNIDRFLASANEKFTKHYNQASDYILEHADKLESEPKSDSDYVIGKIAKLIKTINDADLIFDPNSNYYCSDPKSVLKYDASGFIKIKNILFLKQTLKYLKEENTNVFGTDNLEELNRLGDAVACLDENLPGIIYSAQESLIKYIKDSLPLSNVVKEDMEREILNTQIVEFGFLRNYDYIFDGLSLDDLKDKELIVYKEDNSVDIDKTLDTIINFNDEYLKPTSGSRVYSTYYYDVCTTNATNYWDKSDWDEEAKYMDIRENFIALSVPLLLASPLNGQDIDQCIINIVEILGHEFGHLIQGYSPANIDCFGGQYSANDISSAYAKYGDWSDDLNLARGQSKEDYDRSFTNALNEEKEINNKYTSILQTEDIAYFDDLRNRIKSHFESMSLEDMGYSETERMNGEVIYDEVFSDIYGLNTAMNYMKSNKQTNFEKLFRTHSQFFYKESFEEQEPNEEKQKELRDAYLHAPIICSYPVGSTRVNGVLTMIPEYIEWAKPKANAYHPEFSATDEDTGVQVQADMGKLIDGVKLNVNKLNKDTDEYNTKLSNVDSNIKDQIENIEIYSVSIVDRNGSAVQPEDGVGLVKLRIPIPQGFDKSDLSALYIAYGDYYNDEKSKGNIVNLNGTDYYEFEVTHFSDYSLIDELTIYEKLFWPIVLSSVVVLAVITTSIVVYNKKKKPLLNSK